MRLFLRKPISVIQAECGSSELKRTLTALNLISLGIGCIIGAGIFAMTGQATAQYAGPAIILSFVLAGIACAFAALCYAELASTLPVSGSAYTYAYATLGESLAWIMGWLLILEYGMAASTVAVSWSGYFVSLINGFHAAGGSYISPEWSNPWGLEVTLPDGTITHGIFNTPAFCALMALTGLLILGVKESATANNITVMVKLAVIVVFVAVGVFYITPANWHPFIPEYISPAPGKIQGKYGYEGILHAAAFISFAYVGFEAVSTAAQEAKNPQRDVPLGILGSLAICTVLYMAVAAVLTGLVPYQTLDVPDPMALAVDHIGMAWLSLFVKVGAVIGMLSVMLVLLYGQTRIFYTMARDGLIPQFFARVHPRLHTPWINTLLVGFSMAVIAGLTPIEKLGNLVSIGTLAAFAIISYSVIHLRRQEPALPRLFKVPFYPATPILGIITSVYLMWGLKDTILHLTAYFVLGVLVYAFYGYHHSQLRKNLDNSLS